MDLAEYLRNEGIKDLSSQSWKSVVANIDSRRIKTYDELGELFERLNIQQNIANLYDFMARSGIDLVLESAYFDRTMKSSQRVLSELNGQRMVLDVGCNSGLKTTFYALQRPHTQFIGVDLSEVALEQARKRAEKYGCKNVHYQRQDVLSLPFEPIFDGVIAENSLFETHSYGYFGRGTEDPMFFTKFSKCFSQMKDGKFIVIITPCDMDEIRDIFSNISQDVGFSRFSSEEISFVVEGEKDRVLLFVAEK